LFPGILSQGESFQALGFDTTDVVEYGEPGEGDFDARRIVHDTAVVIMGNLKDGLPALLVGASLGGMLIPFVVGKLHRLMPELPLDLLRCVIIDAPFGVETMTAMSRLPLAGYMIRSPFGHVLRPLAFIKVGPRDKYIDIPNASMRYEIAGETVSAGSWPEYVKQRAIRELTGHSSRQWLEQLRWMTRVGHDGSLHRACLAMTGVETSYLACMGPANDVVTQPLASEWWAASLPDLRRYGADAAHCGFVQQAPTFREALADILG
jgi:hypothetical protein